MQPQAQKVPQETPRTLPRGRVFKIALRTAHLMATSVLVGGYAFSAPATRLAPWLYAAIATGVGMTLFEAYPRLDFLFEGWGLMLLVKLALLWRLGVASQARLPILLAVVALASIGSHMPRRWRHYSLLHRRVMR